MGKVFKYISDEVIGKYGFIDHCQICNKKTQLVNIFIENEKEDILLTEACINCIKTIPLEWICHKSDERLIPNLINIKYPKGTKSQDERFALTVNMASEYRRTPYLPNLGIEIDWPKCCGDFAEFIGDAGSTYKDPLEGFEWWGFEDDYAKTTGIEKMMQSDDKVSLFKCSDCNKKFWTYQCT